jgi:hypothetical protein
MTKLFEIHADKFAQSIEKIRNAYYEEGGFYIRQLLPTSLLVEVAFQVISIINLIDRKIEDEENLTLDPCVINKASKMLIKLEMRHPGSHAVVYDAMDHTSIMYRIASSKIIASVVKEILSDNILIHPRLILLMSMPNSTWHLARWHQDYYYNGEPSNTCTVYAPLQKTNKDNGGLIISKGSLKFGQLSHGDYTIGGEPSKWKSILPKYVDNFTELVQIDMMPGDVLFMHSLTPHTAQTNSTDNVRFVLNLRYRDMMDDKFLNNNWKAEDMSAARAALARMPPKEL